MIGLVVNLLILVSQTANVLLGGDSDEMLSARAWRQRKQRGWQELCWVLDNCSPLMFWKGSYATHCEACYWEERRRLQSRLADYTEQV